MARHHLIMSGSRFSHSKHINMKGAQFYGGTAAKANLASLNFHLNAPCLMLALISLLSKGSQAPPQSLLIEGGAPRALLWSDWDSEGHSGHTSPVTFFWGERPFPWLLFLLGKSHVGHIASKGMDNDKQPPGNHVHYWSKWAPWLPINSCQSGWLY